MLRTMLMVKESKQGVTILSYILYNQCYRILKITIFVQQISNPLQMMQVRANFGPSCFPSPEITEIIEVKFLATDRQTDRQSHKSSLKRNNTKTQSIKLNQNLSQPTHLGILS